MKCPNCGLYHPAFYERCVGCGVSFNNIATDEEPAHKGETEIEKTVNPFASVTDPSKRSLAKIRFGDFADIKSQPVLPEQSQHRPIPKVFSLKGFSLQKIPTKVGILAAIVILLVSAGATAFFLSQSPGDKRLIELGKHQLDLGQYAFAVETLTKATAMKSDDPQAFLALARAYIGIDQVDKAWDCIVHAQQLGVGVVADPTLTSQLANYYRQKGMYEKAVDLLRPLANASVPGKKAELADMDAFRGDECIEKGDLEQAKRCWEEVRDIKEGSRYPEAEARLTTIYTRLADLAYGNHEDEKAIDYINKLNAIGENTKNYLLAAEIYERDGKLNEAIEQVRKSLKLSIDNPFAQSRLAELLSKRGKELIGSGESQSGYGYIEQAKSIDPGMRMPVVTLKDTICKIDPISKRAVLSGQVWNPTNKSVDSLSMRIELCDLNKDKVLWSRNERMIDEFVPPLSSQDTKPFSYSSSYSPKDDENLAFKVYLDGNLYQTFRLNPGAHLAKKTATQEDNRDIETGETPQASQEYGLYQKSKKKSEETSSPLENSKSFVGSQPNPATKQPKETISPEEKTLKDLDY